MIADVPIRRDYGAGVSPRRAGFDYSRLWTPGVDQARVIVHVAGYRYSDYPRREVRSTAGDHLTRYDLTVCARGIVWVSYYRLPTDVEERTRANRGAPFGWILTDVYPRGTWIYGEHATNLGAHYCRLCFTDR